MSAYYNEIDPFAAQWLRELIRADFIPAGDVDERSIEDITPNELRRYTQCHFFAGIGGWAYALDLAGWPRDRPVWTGSCPCQPFSAAGKGAGFADKRHLWPAWFHLIRECRPAVVFGEQVASKAADRWVDLVQSDMEGMGYPFGCVPFPAAGVGSPHGRERTLFVAYADRARCNRLTQQDIIQARRIETPRRDYPYGCGGSAWASALELEGADGARRLLAPGIELLADGLSDSAPTLRAYGNAIVPQQAAAFVRAYLEASSVNSLQAAA